MNRAWRAKSWSAQARVMAKKLYREYVENNSTDLVFNSKTHEVKEVSGHEAAMYFLATSYRAPIIKYRAAKRLGRMMRKHNKITN